jgi:dCMP deaminase
MRPTRDEYLMELAILASKRTTCIRKGVGCVLADGRGRILAVAYNGVSAGMPHCNQPTGFEFVYANGIDPAKPRTGQSTGTADVFGDACPGHDLPPGQDRCEAVHAEQNAIIQCADTDRIHTAYVTTAPCRPCMKLLLNTGCREIVYMEDHPGSDEVKAVWESTGRAWRHFDYPLEGRAW